MMLKLIPLDGVDCDETNVEEAMADTLLFLEALPEPVRIGQYIGSVPVIINPGDSVESVCERFRTRLHLDRAEKDRRRDSSKYDGWEHRSGSDRRRSA